MKVLLYLAFVYSDGSGIKMIRSVFLFFDTKVFHKILYFCILFAVANNSVSAERFIVYSGSFLSEIPAGSALLEESEQEGIHEFKLVTTIQNEQALAGRAPVLQNLALQESLPGFVAMLNARTVTITENSKMESPDMSFRPSSQGFSLHSSIDVNWQDSSSMSHNVRFAMDSAGTVSSMPGHYYFRLTATANIGNRIASLESNIILYAPFSFRAMSIFHRPAPEILSARPTLLQITPMTLIPYLHSSEYLTGGGMDSANTVPYQAPVSRSSHLESFRGTQIVTEYFKPSTQYQAFSSIGFMTGDDATDLAGVFLGWRLCGYDHSDCFVYFKSDDLKKSQKKRMTEKAHHSVRSNAKHLRQKSNSNPDITEHQDSTIPRRPRSHSLQPSHITPVYVSFASAACKLGVAFGFNEQKGQNPIFNKIGHIACNMLVHAVAIWNQP